MGHRPVAVSLLFGLTFFTGCKSSSSAQSSGAAAPAQGASTSSAQAGTPQYLGAAQPTGFQTVTLTDPVMRMKAYDVTIPAGWKFDGLVAQGTQCKTTPFPVFRAYSPDGLSEFRREPRLDWASSTSVVAARAAAANCPQISTSITAADFLRYLAGTMGAQWVADWPMSDASRNSFQASIQQANANYNQSGMRGYSMTGDTAAARTLIQNGSFQVEQQLLVAMICNHTPLPDGTSSIGCTAQTRALRSPKGQLDALVAFIDGHASGAAENPAWDQALNQAAMARTQQIMQQRAAAFQQWSSMMAQEHSQFMQQMQAEGDARTANFNAQMNAKSTAASDWVDYALNQQTVSGSGGVQKVSSSSSTTWSNGQGQTYQTNDSSANPNGVLAGSWSQQQVVHGNGQP